MLPKEIQDDQSFYPSDETLDHLEVYQQLGKKLLGSITIFTFRSRCIGNNTKEPQGSFWLAFWKALTSELDWDSNERCYNSKEWLAHSVMKGRIGEEMKRQLELIFDHFVTDTRTVFLGGKIMTLAKRPEQKITASSSKKVVQKKQRRNKKKANRLSQRAWARNRHFVKAQNPKVRICSDWLEQYANWRVWKRNASGWVDTIYLFLVRLIN